MILIMDRFANTKRWGFNPGIKDYNPWTVDIKEVIKDTDVYRRTVGTEENFDEQAAKEVEEILDLFAGIIHDVRQVFNDPQAASTLRKTLKRRGIKNAESPRLFSR